MCNSEINVITGVYVSDKGVSRNLLEIFLYKWNEFFKNKVNVFFTIINNSKKEIKSIAKKYNYVEIKTSSSLLDGGMETESYDIGIKKSNFKFCVCAHVDAWPAMKMPNPVVIINKLTSVSLFGFLDNYRIVDNDLCTMVCPPRISPICCFINKEAWCNNEVFWSDSRNYTNYPVLKNFFSNSIFAPECGVSLLYLLNILGLKVVLNNLNLEMVHHYPRCGGYDFLVENSVERYKNKIGNDSNKIVSLVEKIYKDFIDESSNKI